MRLIRSNINSRCYKSLFLFATFFLIIVWIISVLQISTGSTVLVNVVGVNWMTTTTTTTNLWPTLPTADEQLEQQPKANDNDDKDNEIDLSVVHRLARAYTPWQGKKYEWCIPKQENWDVMKGILFAKTYKTGSSTASAVTHQMANRVAKRLNLTDACHTVTGHDMSVLNMVINKTFPNIAWTIIRHPTSQAISTFHFYKAGHDKIPTTSTNIINFCEQIKNQQLIQLRTIRGVTIQGGYSIKPHLSSLLYNNQTINRYNYNYNNNTNTTIQLFEQIIKHEILPMYNFIAVMERMDESLVVWKMLLDLEHGDIIVGSNSKQSGGYDWDWTGPAWPNGTCFKIPKPNLTNMVHDYLKTSFKHDNGDFLLYNIVNHNLDLTINALGQQHVQEQVQEYRKLKKMIQIKCQNSIIPPCDNNGNFHSEYVINCYQFDEGCGYQCINNVLDEYYES